MKSVTTQAIQKINGAYQITLGDGTNHHFSSLRKAQSFQVQVNKNLTELTIQFNSIFIELFTIYRTLYPSFEDNRHPGRTQHYYSQSQIKAAIFDILNLFDLIKDNSIRLKSFYRVYADFDLIADKMILIAYTLNNVIANKSINFISSQITAIINRTNSTRFQLQQISTLSAGHPVTIAPLKETIIYTFKNSLTA